MSYCSDCGQQVDDNAIFCSRCGHQLIQNEDFDYIPSKDLDQNLEEINSIKDCYKAVTKKDTNLSKLKRVFGYKKVKIGLILFVLLMIFIIFNARIIPEIFPLSNNQSIIFVAQFENELNKEGLILNSNNLKDTDTVYTYDNYLRYESEINNMAISKRLPYNIQQNLKEIKKYSLDLSKYQYLYKESLKENNPALTTNLFFTAWDGARIMLNFDIGDLNKKMGIMQTDLLKELNSVRVGEE